tara:strand:+ start:74 stop:451 length:378 start_codon:yes stop_codon:yes gene_type:complete
MKKGLLNSTLSCTYNCIRFVIVINKKLIFGLLIAGFLGACTSPSAMLGPAYTLTSSGNVLQAGLNYGANEMISFYTGKTPVENLKEISSLKKENIQKKTLESSDFYYLVKGKIDRASIVLDLPNQ